MWNVDVCQGIAVLKRVGANSCYTVWNVDVCQGIAVLKRVVANNCHAMWNVDVCQGIAAIKRVVANNCCSALLHANRIRCVQSRIAPIVMILTVCRGINRVDVACLAFMRLNPCFNACE